MTARVTEQEENLLELGHDRQEEGVNEEVSPLEKYLWIEHGEALQVDIPQNITPHSPLNSSHSA